MANVGTLFSGEVTIYHHNGGTTYYCRFKNRSGGCGYIKKSLKTKDYAEACTRAKAMYLKHIALVDAGFDPTELNWEQAVAIYAARMDDGQPKSFLIQTNKTYFTNFFTSERFKSLRDIKSGDIIDYFKWRGNFWERKLKGKTKPKRLYCAEIASPATLVKERRFLGYIFRGLFRDRRINRMPDMPTTRRLRRIVANLGRDVVETQNRRPAFEPWEYKKIQAHLYERILATEGWKPSVQLLSAMRLRLWCDLIARTGIRPQELRQVRFSDFQDVVISSFVDDDEAVVIEDDFGLITDDHDEFVRGRIRVRRKVAKTKRARWASDVQEGGFFKILKEWRDLNEEVLKHKMKHGDLVFPAKRWRSDPDEKWDKPIDMSTAFKKMLRKINLYEKVDEDGNTAKRSSYSLRAMFITERIKESMNTRFIAENCGTSQKMIDRFYDGSDGTNFFECLNVRHQNRPDSD